MAGLEEVLAEELVGAYIHGSLALGSFRPGESDVDFLVATERDLAPETVDELGGLHAKLGDRLDGSYLPVAVFRRFDPERVMHPHIEARGGRLAVDHHGGETVIYRYVLLKSGVTLYGPPPQALIDPVGGDQVRQGVRDLVDDWTVDGEPLFAEPWYRRYMVYTMCRVRYTLASGDVTSKPAAAEWALARVEPNWHGLIRRCAAGRECGYEETVAFVRETLALASC